MLKGLSEAGERQLASDLRSKIIDVCSANGGHIAASLGAVELTIALHSEFDTPADSIVWDIGHQSYAHKLLTGREAEFPNLRKKSGPSGFTSRRESVHDVFGAGHSSTSISAALGIAEAKRLKKDTTWTVAVIGDGGLTAGVAFEALNQAGASAEPRLLIIVNDNNLSISENVGALNQWAFGAEREPRKFFESLGFHYVGPVDGHNVRNIRVEIQKIKNGPASKVTVLHALTRKGKGFAPAEREPIRFHGVGPFDKLTGAAEGKAQGTTYSRLFGQELLRLAEQDEKVIAITAAMAEGTGLVEFAKKLPERFYDVGIAEPHALLFAAGLATQGLRPVVGIYSTFLQRAVDSVIHDIALQNLSVVLCIDRAGLVGADGPTHHGAFDIPILRTIPNVCVAAPSDEADMRRMIEEALQKTGLKAIRYPRGEATIRDSRAPKAKWGKARILNKAKAKSVLLIWAFGQGANWAEEALAGMSENEKRKITLVDARFAKPVDEATLKKTLAGAKTLVTIEDGSIAGGFGSAVIEAAFSMGLQLPKHVERLGIPDFWIEHAEIGEQRADLKLSSRHLLRTFRMMLK